MENKSSLCRFVVFAGITELGLAVQLQLTWSGLPCESAFFWWFSPLVSWLTVVTVITVITGIQTTECAGPVQNVL